jgi:hypothetical protein
VQRLEHWPDAANGDNLLVNSSAEMLNFRFPRSRHLIYSVADGQRQATYLIFTRPQAGASVKLKHWSGLELAPPKMMAVVEDVMARCRREKAASLRLCLPEADAQSMGYLKKAGFIRTKQVHTVYFHSSKKVGHEKKPASWRFTDAHFEFF